MSEAKNLLNLFRSSKDENDIELFILLALPIIGKEGIKNMIADYFIDNLRSFFKKKMRKKASPELEAILTDMRRDLYNLINDNIVCSRSVGCHYAGLEYSHRVQNWIPQSVFDAIPDLLKYEKYMFLSLGHNSYKLNGRNRVENSYCFFRLENDNLIFNVLERYLDTHKTKKTSRLR